MPEYPRLTAKDAEKFLLRSGFVLDRQKGSHRIYIKKTYRMILPSHAGEILHPKIIKQLLTSFMKLRTKPNTPARASHHHFIFQAPSNNANDALPFIHIDGPDRTSGAVKGADDYRQAQ